MRYRNFVCKLYASPNMNNVSTSIILDKRFKLSDGTYRVKLRLTFERKQKYYPLKEKFTPEEFELVCSPKARGRHKDFQLLFNEIELKAQETINALISFSFEAFEKKYNKYSGTKNNVVEYFDQHIALLKKMNKIGTSVSYQTALNSFLRYNDSCGVKNWSVFDITPEWLAEYQLWMENNHATLTTVGFYTRSLRTIINQIIEEGKLPKDLYPFGRRKYVIPTGRNIKKALNKELIKKIAAWESPTEAYERARDFWYFSYLCNGMNFGDIAQLQWKDLHQDYLVFYRSKTKNTTRHNPKPIVVIMMMEIRKIIDRWGSRQGDFIFDIISGKEPADEKRKKIQQFIKTNNKYTKRIGEELGLGYKLTTYHARHSFATVIMLAGGSSEFIKEKLGHSDVRTTKSYLGDFDLETSRKFQEALL